MKRYSKMSDEEKHEVARNDPRQEKLDFETSGKVTFTLPTEDVKQSFSFKDYDAQAWPLAQYPFRNISPLYTILGLVGETGEIAEKFKKAWRNKGQYWSADFTRQEKQALALEAGDALWYVMALAHELGYTLEEVAQMNLKKLLDRNERGVIKGEGDDR
jgi:NTP pyrophosphatase (non-canonical NTP hydrolase)